MGWFGKKVNRSKSSIHFRKKISGPLAMPISDLLGLKRMQAKAKHLGMPLLFPHSKYRVLADLKQRIFTKLVGWKAKLLSQAGRATMLRNVAFALPAYSVGFVAFLQKWCVDVDRSF